MNIKLREDSNFIINNTIACLQPDNAVNKALDKINFNNGKIYLVAIGKAAFSMAKSACNYLDYVDKGIVITKYGHIKGNIENVTCYQAGHPVVDQNSIDATNKVLEMVQNLKKEDNVLFLISGGGSALFEKPKISLSQLQDINKQLLACGANINEINVIRKHLSYVKGGNFAKACFPAHVFSIVLSDVIGNDLATIASGPAYIDTSTSKQALAILDKYNIKVDDNVIEKIKEETVKQLDNITTYVTGSVSELCKYAKQYCQQLGYETYILTDCLQCEASQAGKFLGSIALTNSNKHKLAFIAGGETVVHLTGYGKGGRNQEIALSSAAVIKGCKNVAVFSFGSDGTDGPTDAAGGYVDGNTYYQLLDKGISIEDTLLKNDSYNALKQVNGLIITGPTGTNVNDVSIILID